MKKLKRPKWFVQFYRTLNASAIVNFSEMDFLVSSNLFKFF